MPTMEEEGEVLNEVINTDDSQTEDGSEMRRKVTKKTTYKIDENTTATTTMTKTMTTRKLYGRDLSEYEHMDVDELLNQLSNEELEKLSKEVDPDDNLLPPDQRCSYACGKRPTGPLNRRQLIDYINKIARETPDRPELKPYIAGVVRGKKFVAPERPLTKQEEEIAVDLGDEYESALSAASEEELVDLAAILGFHSMMNQEQYHSSLLNKGQPLGLGFHGTAKAFQPKALPVEPPNQTDLERSIQKLREDDYELVKLNLNNIPINDEQFGRLFEALRSNTHLDALSLSNTGLGDKPGMELAQALEKNGSLRSLNVETNNLSPPTICALVRGLLQQKRVEEFRASNQRQQTLGNKMETEITHLIEQNPTLLRLGLHLEYNDARNRVATHLQRNLDRKRLKRIGQSE